MGFLPQELKPGAKLLGYQVLGLLAQGGMAEVYLARRPGSGADMTKAVVIKRIRPNLVEDPSFVRMFTDEAKLAQQLSHPCVVKVLEIGNEGGNWALCMEFLDGRNLLRVARACYQRRAYVPYEIMGRIMADSLDGLHHAHTLKDKSGKPVNMVHRDMSPENIVITYDGRVKVVDFGIAKAANMEGRTQAGVIKGKLGYVAPEAIAGEVLDGRADVFAMGVTLYELLTYTVPFSGANEVEILTAISTKEPQSPRALNPSVPEPLEKICMKALEKNRNKRWQSALDMKMGLEAFIKSTGKGSTPAHLAAFMEALFPAGTDKERQRVDQLMQLPDAPATPASTSSRAPSTAARNPTPATPAQKPSSPAKSTTSLKPQKPAARSAEQFDLPPTEPGQQQPSLKTPGTGPKAPSSRSRSDVDADAESFETNTTSKTNGPSWSKMMQIAELMDQGGMPAPTGVSQPPTGKSQPPAKQSGFESGKRPRSLKEVDDIPTDAQELAPAIQKQLRDAKPDDGPVFGEDVPFTDNPVTSSVSEGDIASVVEEMENGSPEMVTGDDIMQLTDPGMKVPAQLRAQRPPPAPQRPTEPTLVAAVVPDFAAALPPPPPPPIGVKANPPPLAATMPPPPPPRLPPPPPPRQTAAFNEPPTIRQTQAFDPPPPPAVDIAALIDESNTAPLPPSFVPPGREPAEDAPLPAESAPVQRRMGRFTAMLLGMLMAAVLTVGVVFALVVTGVITPPKGKGALRPAPVDERSVVP